MLLYRSIGEKELRNLFQEDSKILGQYNCKIEGQNNCNSSATCCFFVDEILWKDANHRFMIVVDIPEDYLTFGIGTYFAAKSLAKTKIWSGRDGSEIYKLREAYINSYKISQVKEVYLFDYFANHFIESSLRPICDKYGIKLFTTEKPFINSKQTLALRCQAYTIEYRIIFGHFEYTRFRITLLWARCYCSNLHKSKTESRKWSKNLTISVVTCCYTDWIAKTQPKNLSLQSLILHSINLAKKPLDGGYLIGNTEQQNRERMSSLGSEKV